jgi:hypothetical protein
MHSHLYICDEQKKARSKAIPEPKPKTPSGVPASTTIKASKEDDSKDSIIYLRVPSSLKKMVEEEAWREKLSVNAYVIESLEIAIDCALEQRGGSRAPTKEPPKA